MSANKRNIRGKNHESPETRRAELLDAAIICFNKAGFNATTIDHIAKQAGLSKGSVYRFFASKDDILLAIIKKFDSEISIITNKASEHCESPLEKIRVILETSIDYLDKQKDMTRVWDEFSYQPKSKQIFSELVNQHFENLEQIIQSGIEKGELRDQPVRPMIDIIFSFQAGILEMSLLMENFDAVERFREAWPVISRALVK